MLVIETIKANIKQSAQSVYEFVSNSENIGKILPEQVQNFKGDFESCVFEVKGLSKIGLQIETRVPIEKVVYKNTEKTPVKFTLHVQIEATKNNECNTQLIFNGDVNPMMKMMLEKPLNNLFSGMAKKLEEIMNV
jgi:hypothetical protein